MYIATFGAIKLEPNMITLDSGETIDSNDVSEAMEVRGWTENNNGTWTRHMIQILSWDDTKKPAGEITSFLETITEKEYFKQKLAGTLKT